MHLLVYVNDSNTHTLAYIFVSSLMCYVMCIMYDFIFRQTCESFPK